MAWISSHDADLSHLGEHADDIVVVSVARSIEKIKRACELANQMDSRVPSLPSCEEGGSGRCDEREDS